MNYLAVLGFLTAALAALPATSHAQQLAYTAKEVNLRAGPSRDYPIVAMLPAGVAISVEGCLSDYRWCDVVAGPNRGWVYAGNILYPYQGSTVPVLTYGAIIGIGIIAFSVGDYWDHHYRASPWYPQRQRWIDRPHPAFGPSGHRLPPRRPGFGPGGGHRPPQGQRLGRGHRPPQAQGPSGSRHPPRGRRPEGARNP